MKGKKIMGKNVIYDWNFVAIWDEKLMAPLEILYDPTPSGEG